MFRIVVDLCCIKPQNSATESIPATLRPTFPLAYAWAVMATAGSNTETDDDCRPATFHRGAFGCENALLDLTLTEAVKLLTAKSGYIIENTKTINFRRA